MSDQDREVHERQEKQKLEEIENTTCRFCNKQISELEMAMEANTFIESCFHMCHIQCLVKSAILAQSKNQLVLCPRKGCAAEVPTYQLNMLMNQEDKAKVEKA